MSAAMDTPRQHFSLFGIGFSERSLGMLKAVVERYRDPVYGFGFGPMGDVEILIVNGDIPNVVGSVARIRTERPCPAVVLSTRMRDDIPDSECLLNPLSPRTFLDTLHRIADRMREPPAIMDAVDGKHAPPGEARRTPGSKAAKDESVQGAAQAASALERDLGELDNRGGYLREVDFSNPEQVQSLFFNPDGFLSEYLRRVLRGLRDDPGIVEFVINGHPFVIDLVHNRWGGEFDEQALHGMCLAPLYAKPEVRRLAEAPRGMRLQGHAERVHGQTDFSESRHLINSHRTRRADFILAQIGLWCARGHLPAGTDLHAQLRLRHWPNLPQLPRTHGAMQIASLWMQSPCSLVQTVERTGFQQRHVFAFYVICHTLGLFDEERGGQGARQPAQAGRPRASASTPQQRGFLQRLLNKVWKREE